MCEQICPVCGEKVEVARLGEDGRLCYGCWMDTRLPRWTEASEDYTGDLVDLVAKARRRVRFGMALFDAPAPPRVCNLAKGVAAAMGGQELACGFDEDGPELGGIVKFFLSHGVALTYPTSLPPAIVEKRR